jgi:predicted nucleic acid-binding protein
VSRYVVDASVGIKWFLPEIHSEAASRLQFLNASLHVPAFFHLELGSVLSKRIRRNELTSEEGEAILKELKQIPLQKHSNERLFKPAFALALQTKQSLYDCLYLALAETIDGQVVTADRKFYSSLASGQYGQSALWVEELAQLK